MQIPVLLLWEKDGQEHREDTFTLTVSWFGCSVYSHNFFRTNSRVRLQRDSDTMEAQVVYSLKDRSANLVELRLEFDQDAREFWGIGV